MQLKDFSKFLDINEVKYKITKKNMRSHLN